MRALATYDLMESLRNTNQWLGATAYAFGSYPFWGLAPTPMFQMMAAWGEVTERSFARMVTRPDWEITDVVCADGRDHQVTIEKVIQRPFGDLIRFRVSGRPEKPRRILLCAPMSGHYATLLRSTVQSLLPDAEVWITDWHNARDIPVSAGKFDIEDYTQYLADFMKELGPETHVIAVCQPAPLALAATALLAEDDPAAQPATLTLIGGPIDPDAAATDVTDFGRRVTMGQLEKLVIQRVGFSFAGAGRQVYPGMLQLLSFISMNSERHAEAFAAQILRIAQNESGDNDKHNRFYDEYLAVMDMTAEFYLSTVERVFKGRDIARNAFTIGDRAIDIGKITDVAVITVEGEKDDISAPGQCLAALDLCTGLDESKKAFHLEPGAGHYGIFAGRGWRDNIRPMVLQFIDANSRTAAAEGVEATRHAPAAEVVVEPAAAAKPASAAKPKASGPAKRKSTRAASSKAPTASATAAKPANTAADKPGPTRPAARAPRKLRAVGGTDMTQNDAPDDGTTPV